MYQPTHLCAEQLISQHEDYTDMFAIPFKDEDKTLPVIFATPKLHKTPYKFRFIAGARLSSMKPVSVYLTRILTHMKEHLREYCSTIQSFTGFNSFWSVDSSLAVVQNINAMKKVKSITTADFSS
ncbi:MAG: hypothetical protein GY893_14015, partial [bacterium]|nr:hypothetical protein [bacterium]